VKTSNGDSSLPFRPINQAGSRLEEQHVYMLVVESVVNGAFHDIEPSHRLLEDFFLSPSKKLRFVSQCDLT
jgi:hypothetical protein